MIQYLFNFISLIYIAQISIAVFSFAYTVADLKILGLEASYLNVMQNCLLFCKYNTLQTQLNFLLEHHL